MARVLLLGEDVKRKSRRIGTGRTWTNKRIIFGDIRPD